MSEKKAGEAKKGEIVIYKSKEGPKIDVRLDKETVWLTLKQMSILFDKGIPTINEHLKNVYRERELEKNSTIRKFRIVQIKKSGEKKINDNALAPLALLIAINDPKEKDKMIKIVTNLLAL